MVLIVCLVFTLIKNRTTVFAVAVAAAKYKQSDNEITDELVKKWKRK